MNEYKKIAEEIFLAGVRRVMPSTLIPSCLSIGNDILKAGPYSIDLSTIKNIYVIGAGKASAAMAAEVEKILGDRISGGHIIVKYGHTCLLRRVELTEAGHPVPDESGFLATKKILDIVSNACEDDLVICLISGGGSALLADYPVDSSPQEIIKMNDLLVNSGADISEINSVRKHVSAIKGGQLARSAYPANILNLILSDVPCDQVEVIASGPTVADPTTFRQAFEVLEKYKLVESVPPGIVRHLNDGCKGTIPDTPKPGDKIFDSVINILAGTNTIALEAASARASVLGLKTIVADGRMQGDVAAVAKHIFETAVRFRENKNEKMPVCILFGGEPTVRMTGKGKGGRNQHLALLVAALIKDMPGITFLSGGTDGNDGPTEAAGAVVDSATYKEAASNNIIAEDFIERFDAYNFFAKTGGHVITGPTMTNVMDIMVLIVIY